MRKPSSKRTTHHFKLGHQGPKQASKRDHHITSAEKEATRLDTGTALMRDGVAVTAARNRFMLKWCFDHGR